MCAITAGTNLLHGIGQRDAVQQSADRRTSGYVLGGGGVGLGDILAKSHSAWMLQGGFSPADPDLCSHRP